jgi:hypothetical protein
MNNFPMKACAVCATVIWIGLLVAAFTGAPGNATGAGWQPSKSSRVFNQASRPERGRRELARAHP